MEQQTVNHRLNLLVDHFEKGRKAAFARTAGISPQGLQELLVGRQGDPSFKVLVKILESYPQVRIEWLVLGEGPMLRDSISADDSSLNTRGLFLALDAELKELNKRLTQWQDRLTIYVNRQEEIDIHLAFLHSVPEAKGAEGELFIKAMTFSESMSEGNKVDIINTETGIQQIHARLAVLHQRIAEVLESKPASRTSAPAIGTHASYGRPKPSGTVN